jgi:hypothetical protein
LQIEIGNAFVEPGNGKFRVGLNRLLKKLQSLFEKLLVHVGAAQVVQTSGLGRIGLGCRRKQAKSG